MDDGNSEQSGNAQGSALLIRFHLNLATGWTWHQLAIARHMMASEQRVPHKVDKDTAVEDLTGSIGSNSSFWARRPALRSACMRAIASLREADPSADGRRGGLVIAAARDPGVGAGSAAGASSVPAGSQAE